MKTEKQIVEKLVSLAKEYGRTEVDLKNSADEVVENTQEAITRHENDLRILGQILSQHDFAIRIITNFFED